MHIHPFTLDQAVAERQGRIRRQVAEATAGPTAGPARARRRPTGARLPAAVAAARGALRSARIEALRLAPTAENP